MERTELSLEQTIEEEMLLGRLRPRERLVEEELQLLTGGTRHGVRLALSHLEARGLVKKLPNKGAQVGDFEFDEFNELCVFCDYLHDYAATNILLPAKQDCIERLLAIQNDHDHAIDAKDAISIYRADTAFHNQLFSQCNNKYLINTISTQNQFSLVYRFQLISRIDLAVQAQTEHRLILQALDKGDSEWLRSLFVNHTYPSREAYRTMRGWRTDSNSFQ